MKKIPLLLLLPFLSSIFISCSEDKEADPLAMLPAISQTGANTFGCLVDGKVFYPRDERVGALFSPSPMNGVEIYGSPNGQEYTEFYVVNYVTGKPAVMMVLHLEGLHQTGMGTYTWGETNFQYNIDGPMHNYMYCEVYNAETNDWRYYGSFENSGSVIITHYDFDNRIVSGTFSGTVRKRNSTEVIEIKDGRFDFDKLTVPDAYFP